MAEIQVNVSQALRDEIRRTYQALPMAAAAGAVAAGYSLQAHMKSEYLSGQRLRVRTGKLRSGWWVAAVPGGAVVATSTEYAAVHEYGFNGKVTIPQHTRRNTPRKSANETKAAYKERLNAVREQQYQGRGKKNGTTGYATVRAHQREMHVRPKFYVRDTVKLGGPQALRVFRATVAERCGWRGDK